MERSKNLRQRQSDFKVSEAALGLQGPGPAAALEDSLVLWLGQSPLI